MTEHNESEDKIPVGLAVVIAAGGALYQSLSIIAALSETKSIDPLRVAAWAEFFAANFGEGRTPEAAAGISDVMRNFASSLRTMASGEKVLQ